MPKNQRVVTRMDQGLLQKLDELVARLNYPDRATFIRDAVAILYFVPQGSFIIWKNAALMEGALLEVRGRETRIGDILKR